MAKFIYLSYLIGALLFIGGTAIGSNYINTETAFSLARNQHKNIFITYEVEWCQDCSFLNDSVLANPYIKSVIESDYILVQANLDNPNTQEWFKIYKVSCMPTFQILDEQGSVLLESSILGEEDLYAALLDHSIPNRMILSSAENHQASNASERSVIESNQTEKALVRETVTQATILNNQELVIEPDYPSHISTLPDTKALEVENESKATTRMYTVTMGAFSDYNNAQKWLQKQQGAYPTMDFFIEDDPGSHLFRVNGGRFSTKGDGLKLEALFKEENIDCYTRKMLLP